MAVPTDQLVLPPPITRVIQALDTANPDIPGEIKLDAHGKLFKTYMEYNGFGAPLIDAFDTWILRILPAQIAAHELNTPTGIVRFNNVLVESPKILGRDEILIPTRARNEGLTYNGAINADMQLTRKPTLIPRPAGLVGIVPEVRVERLQGPTHLGFIPIMLNSSPCHLRGKTDAERLAMGECLKDPFSYFIVKGSERLIIIQEKLRRHRPFLYAQDTKGKTIIVRMTCGTIKGDSIVTVYKFDKDPVIRLGLRFLGRSQGAKPNTISIFQAFRILGILTPDSMLQRITQFTRPEWVQKVWYQLQPSLMHLSLVADDVEDISRMKGIQSLPYETRRTTILRDLTDELFPQMINDPLDRKLDLLAIMIVRMAEYMAGLRKLDDRDSWSNKRLETAARAMAQLFMGLWTKVITDVQDEITRTKTDTLEGVSRLMQARVRTITDEFVSSFNSNNWGVKGSLQKENITEFLKRESLLSVYSHIMRINTPASRKAKQPSLRLVHFTSTGYVCPSETPEGENCGLTKNLASTAFASIERDEVPLWNLIMNRVHDQPNELYRTSLLFNGKFKGWCAGETLRSECIALRREGLIYRDTEIVLPQVRVRDEVQTEGFLYINSDGGLVMRPLLIVENGELVLHRRQREWAAEIKQLLEVGQREQAEAKRLWSLKWDTLVSHGCAEYIGAFEQEYILLAQSMHDLKMRQNDLLSARQLLQQAQAEFTRMPTEEIKARVAAAQDALSNIEKRRPYTHCELDPSAILGVAASIIPMPEKQPGPRSTFQCVATHEPVLLADGTWKAIGDLKDGQEVVTVDPVTLQVKTTKIHSHFIRPSKDSGKRMLRISTWKGHSLDVTADHMFLTTQGWIEAQYIAGHSLAMYTKGQISFELVGSIIPLPDVLISDFTTEAGTHSFVAGPGFVVHNCSMGKQSLGIYHSNYMNRFDTTVKTLAFPTRPIFEPQMNQLIGLNELPAGRMVTIAIMTYLGFNQEDAFIIKKSSIDLGLFWYMKYTTYKVIIKSTRDFREQLGKPTPRPGEEAGRYDILDDRGLPVPGSRFHQGKALIGKNRTNNTTGEVSNASIYAGVGEEGIIDSILVSTNTDNHTVIKVKTVTLRKPVVGDKIASRYSQKGTIGLILPDEDMPVNEQGVSPDIIVNPHAIPSRMTIGKLIEIVASKLGALKGERINATAFRDFDVDAMRRGLKQYGYNEWGYETYYSGITGKPIQAQIFSGPCYYQMLRHHVIDKKQARSTGLVKPLQRAPVGGRATEGGSALRIGEMERDAFISHGAAATLQERLCIVADKYKTVFCTTCGTIAISDQIQHLYACRKCNDTAHFKTATIPYAYKLLVHYLAGAGLNMTLKMA